MATTPKNNLGPSGRTQYLPERHAPVEIGEVNSIEHTARIFGVSVAQVTKLQSEGKLLATRISRKSVFTRESIMQFIRENTEARPA